MDRKKHAAFTRKKTLSTIYESSLSGSQIMTVKMFSWHEPLSGCDYFLSAEHVTGVILINVWRGIKQNI
jgi:hypothetical protein